VQSGCVGLYARVFDEQEPMRKLKDIDGLFNGRHFDREIISSGRRYAEELPQQGGWRSLHFALSPV